MQCKSGKTVAGFRIARTFIWPPRRWAFQIADKKLDSGQEPDIRQIHPEVAGPEEPGRWNQHCSDEQHQNYPAVPTSRRAPVPTVAFRGVPVLRLIRHAAVSR